MIEVAGNRRSEAGFTTLEMLTVVALIGILANIAVPAALHAVEQARATAVVADYRTFRDAVTRYHLDMGEYPRDRKKGKEPPELRDYLDGALRWSGRVPDIRYDWEYWVRRNGRPRKARTGIAVGFSVWTKDRAMLQRIDDAYDGVAVRVNRNKLTFMIEPVEAFQ